MKINIFYDNKEQNAVGVAGQTAIYFRYYDKTNFYVLKMNMPGRQATELYKTVQGEEHLIGHQGDPVKFGLWYHYYIVFHEEHI